MELSYKELEGVLGAHLTIRPERIGTFRARIKQLQRLEFPVGVNIGRGGKMAYSERHLFQLATALELMLRSWYPAKTAADLVSGSWETFAAGYALASRDQWAEPRYFARISAPAGEDLQFGSDAESIVFHGSAAAVYIEDQPSLARLLESPHHARRSNSQTLLFLSDIYDRLAGLAQDRCGVALEGALRGWLPREREHWLNADAGLEA